MDPLDGLKTPSSLFLFNKEKLETMGASLSFEDTPEAETKGSSTEASSSDQPPTEASAWMLLEPGTPTEQTSSSGLATEAGTKSSELSLHPQGERHAEELPPEAEDTSRSSPSEDEFSTSTATSEDASG